MDDLNVTLASKAEQQRNPQNSQRRQLPVLPPPKLLSLPFPCFISLSVFLSWLCLSDFLISLPHFLAFLSPSPCLSLFLSLTLFLSHIHSISFSLPFSLMISTNGREANSAVALNVKWQAIAAVHSHRYVDANNKTQRLDFTTGDFGLLF